MLHREKIWVIRMPNGPVALKQEALHTSTSSFLVEILYHGVRGNNQPYIALILIIVTGQWKT